MCVSPSKVVNRLLYWFFKLLYLLFYYHSSDYSRHFDFSKLAVYVIGPVYSCDSASFFRTEFRFNRTICCTFKTTTICHFECAKVWFLSHDHSLNQNAHLDTKFHRNRVIRGCNIQTNHFQNGAVRHLEFSKFVINVTRTCEWFCFPPSSFSLIGEHDAASAYRQKNFRPETIIFS